MQKGKVQATRRHYAEAKKRRRCHFILMVLSD